MKEKRASCCFIRATDALYFDAAALAARFPYKSYFMPRIIFRGCISRCSPKSCNLSGESKSRDTYPFDEVLERETSFAYMCYTGEEEREGREQGGVEDTRFTVNLSFSDYESFLLYLDSSPWER